MKINLPNRNGQNGQEAIEINEPIVIVGANGSGKSRLGAWIEQHNTRITVQRISAHRALNIPDFAPMKSLEEAINDLLYGSSKPEHWNVSSKSIYKWHQKPNIDLQNDYQKVLSALFAKSAKRDNDYVKLCQSGTSEKKPPIPQSVIEVLIDIWRDVLPQRTIELEDGKITVKKDDSFYHGKEMSDGERVALYLLGQCLCVPDKSVIIIDEPELHLHKALMSRLWNKVEEARNDCLFIYITHDLDFAASRTNVKKIWAKTYEGHNKWTWEEVPEVDEIPENLVLEIIGSRKPILFVEGETGSYDYEIYQCVFPDFTIIPRGGCNKVIESTKALRASTNLHSISAFGLIDRDYRSDEEIEFLEKSGIIFSEVAVIENLLCCPEIVSIVAQNQVLNANEILQQVKDFVIKQLTDDFDNQVSFRTALEINFRLNAFNQKAIGKEALKLGIEDLVKSIDVDAMYEKNIALYQKIIDERDLEGALKKCKIKGLLPQMYQFFNLGNKDYPNLVLRLLKTDKKTQIVTALKKYIPEIELKNT